MKWLAAERSHDLDALAQRVLDSYLGRSVLRFVRIEGFDRCIVLSAQTFTALIPLFIVVASATPTSDANAIGDVIIERFALTGDSADAVQQLFQTPPGASSGVTAFSLLLLVYSGVAFTRRMQRMYRAAFDQEKAALRSAVYATLGLFALLLEIFVAYGIRVIFSHFPLESLWVLPVSLATGLVLWTSIPYLLLDRRVHWRRLLVTGGASALGMSLFGVATPIYMPQLMTKATNEFGLFGITITIIGWLLVASFILVACAALGAEFDASDAPWLVRLKARFQLVDPGHGDLAAAPAETQRRGLTSADLEALVRGLTNWLVLVAAVWLATVVVPGIHVTGGVLSYLVISVIFGLVNAVLGPFVHWLAGSRSWLRVGGSTFVVNGLLLATTAGLSPKLDIDGFGSAVAGAVVISIAATLLELVVRPVQATPGDDRSQEQERDDV